MTHLPKFPEEHALAQSLKTPYALEKFEKFQLGAQIKKFRKKSGMTQKDLAKKLKTSQSVIARIEAGQQNLTLRTLVNLSLILGAKFKVQLG